MKTFILHIRALVAASVLLLAAACGGEEQPGDYDRVLIVYSAGFNSLSNYLKDDITELKNGYIPSSKGKEVLLVASKTCERSGDYRTQTEPVLFRISKDGRKGQQVVLDTLMTLPRGTVMADSGTMAALLSYISEKFPSKSYGMIFSSHATGWLPEGYFSNPGMFDNKGADQSRRRNDGLVPYYEKPLDPSLPPVRSAGQEVYVVDGKRYTKEMEIEDLAAAVTVHMDYILFDACLMGGIEVAYALRNVTDFVGVAPTEVLAEGIDYSTVASRLLLETPAAPQKVCSDFYDTYDRKTGQSRSATISYIDCRKLGDLAGVCRELFGKYGDVISVMDADNVQGYFYDSAHHWHYDLYDIVAKAGADPEELARLQEALDKCVTYKAATPSFFQTRIETYSGLSMYLPSDGSPYLNEYYKTLSWNGATGLVK